jgi:hypothetical protein
LKKRKSTKKFGVAKGTKPQFNAETISQYTPLVGGALAIPWMFRFLKNHQEIAAQIPPGFLSFAMASLAAGIVVWAFLDVAVYGVTNLLAKYQLDLKPKGA